MTERDKIWQNIYPILAFILLAIGIAFGVESRFLPVIFIGLAAFLFFQDRSRGEFKILFWFSLALFVLFLLSPFGTVLFPFAIGLWLAFLLSPIVERLERYKIPRVLSSITLLLISFIFFIFFFTYLFYQVVTEAGVFLQTLPTYIAKWWKVLENYLGRFVKVEEISNILPTLEEVIRTLFRRTLALSKGILSIVGSLFLLVLTFIVTFYFLKDYKKLKSWIIKTVEKEKTLLRFTDEVILILRRYFRGQIIDATIVGILTGISLAILGINFPLLLGFLAGIMNLVPNLGFWLSFIPALFVGLMEPSPLIGILKVSLVFGGVQLVESTILVPKIIGGSVGLHPLVIFSALLLGAKLLGPLGLFLAVPVAAVLKAVWITREKMSRKENETKEGG
jgi:predicted PurR-regulated permease PerM